MYSRLPALSVIGRKPPRAVAIAVSVALVVLWALMRLRVFTTSILPLSYAIPLFVAVWTRDLPLMWGMAASFVVLHHVNLLLTLPAGALNNPSFWSNYAATHANILIGVLIVRTIVRLRDRLESTLTQVSGQAETLQAQSDELARQNEELAQQTEELAGQTEELSRQAEELREQSEQLATQNEELQSQAEEIGSLNTALARRESLMELLLATERAADTEGTAVQHILNTAGELFGDSAQAAVIYEGTGSGVQINGMTLFNQPASPAIDNPRDDFIAIVLDQQRTASLDDSAARQDLRLLAVPGGTPFCSVLSSPIVMNDCAVGAFAVYGERPHQWTEDEFRLIEWLAGQSSRAIQALRAQKELREADRRKSEFLATLSHELRNPLAPIRFALQLMQAGDGQPSSPLRVVERQVNQLTRLVDDLLNATRLSSNKIQIRRARIDLAPVVRQAVEALQPAIEASRHHLTVALPHAPVWIDGDGERLSQVVTNLLTNAIRYTPTGGAITVQVSATATDVTLSVADNGIGIDAADHERVFEMFTQVGGPGSGGLGIGLSLVRGIVSLHDGTVSVRSSGRGQGSDFRVVLPLAAASDVRPEPAPTTAGAAPRRVLVVDDNADSADMMAMLLQQYGHTVAVTYTAEAALGLAPEFRPDTALLDIGLPGLDGYELARRFREDPRMRNVRLIAVTGWGQESDRLRAKQAGFDTHLTKPVEPAVVLGALTQPKPS